MEHITSKDNLQVKRYVKLRDRKKHRQEEGAFVIESVKLLAEAVAADVCLEVVFYTEQALVKQEDLLRRIAKTTTRHYLINEELERRMTITDNAGGVFAIAKLLDKSAVLGTMKEGGRFCYLSSLQDTGNVGTILRTALALGLSGVILSADTCDVYSPKVLRASMGAVFHLPLYHGTEIVADLQTLSPRFTTYATVVDPTATPVTAVTFPPDHVVVIGNEGNGLPADVVSLCDHAITIPMKGKAESLNAGMAAGILMWEQMK